MLKIGISGCSGKMGQALVEVIAGEEGVVLGAAYDVPGSELINHDAGSPAGKKTGVKVCEDINIGLQDCDVLIDFTRPKGSLGYLESCVTNQVPFVIGTTGFKHQEIQYIEKASLQIPIVMAPNMSVGVNLLFNLVEKASTVVGDSFDAEVIEAHHRRKVDSPSGTAIRIGEIIAAATGRDLSKSGVYSRDGIIGERGKTTIGFATIRGGDIVGDHTALFAGEGERIEITHKASDRTTFARGAIRAARFVSTKSNGLFDMRQVLGL